MSSWLIILDVHVHITCHMCLWLGRLAVSCDLLSIVQGFQLVVTGHSLGAGVASILSLLIKQKMKYSDEMMQCYAFSPPGALFR